MTKKNAGRFAATKLALSIAAALTALGSTSASAFQINTGNSDVALRWDNTLRYGLGWRMGAVNADFANHYAYDETESIFKRGDLVQNRVDLLSEVDLVWKERYGFRVSAALWSENAYPGKPRASDQISALGAGAPPSNYGGAGEWSDYTSRYMTGTSGEFLDAFVFGGFNLGSTSLNAKAGQHNVYWGEAMYTTSSGIAHGQGPMDMIKAVSSPGSQAKELFLPLKQLSAHWALSDEVSVLGQYLLDWKPHRSAAGGTFFAAADAANTACVFTIPGLCIPILNSVTPGRKGGDYGLAVKWAPGWLDGTLGFYYRKYDEKLPWGAFQMNTAMGLRTTYAQDTELFGLSLAKNIGSVSTGLEVSYRKNTALNAINLYFTRGTGAPSYSEAEGPRGNSFHVVANVVKLLNKNALWETGNVSAELVYDRLDKVTKYSELFYSMDYACKNGAGAALTLQPITAGAQNKDYGCATRDSLAFSVSFNPQWMEVMPSIDLSMPMFYTTGLKGNSPVLFGSNEGFSNWSVGLSAIYRTLYQVDLSLNGMHTNYGKGTGTGFDGLTGQPIQAYANGQSSISNGHTWLSLRFKTSF